MHLAQDPGEWLASHAMYCNRYHARITDIGCEENRQRVDDCRCNGCSGLEEEEREVIRAEPVVFLSDEPEELDPEPLKEALAEALQDVLEWDGTEDYEEDNHGDPDGEELTGFQKELLALLGDDLCEEIVERKPEKKGSKRFAIFMGRCSRCQGYMVNIPERYDDIRDDDVYRCFNCGHRTSPGYSWNRHQGA